MDINRKVILITGASSGIGRATAVALSKLHNKIIIVARRKQMLEEVAAEVKKNGSDCRWFAGDALDENFCENVVEKVVNAYGTIDIAILNIGIGPPFEYPYSFCRENQEMHDG